jgi:hypothetical protein
MKPCHMSRTHACCLVIQAMYSSLPTKRVCCGLGEDGADKARVRAGAWLRAGATTRIARRAHALALCHTTRCGWVGLKKRLR